MEKRKITRLDVDNLLLVSDYKNMTRHELLIIISALRHELLNLVSEIDLYTIISLNASSIIGFSV